MSRVERFDGPRDNTPHDEANCPHCQRDIAAMTQPAPAPDVPGDVTRYTAYDPISGRRHLDEHQYGDFVAYSSYSAICIANYSLAESLAAKDAVIAELTGKLEAAEQHVTVLRGLASGNRAYAIGDRVICLWEGIRKDIATIRNLPIAGGQLYVIHWPDGGTLCVAAEDLQRAEPK